MRILITGGAGFIGRHLAVVLRSHGHTVTVMDDLATANSKFGASVLRRHGIDVEIASACDEHTFGRLISRNDVIVHAASSIGVAETMQAPRQTLTHIGAAAFLSDRTTPRQAIVFLSTSDVYGMHSVLYQGKPMSEDDLIVHEAPQSYRWVYARMKAVGEILISTARARSATVRIFNCYGPSIDYPEPRRILPRFFEAVLRGEPLLISGDGTQRRAYCHVDDMVDGIVRVVEHVTRLDASDHFTVNLGNPDEEASVNDLARLVIDVCAEYGLGKGVQTLRRQELYTRPFDDSWNRAPDITRAKEVLGYIPQVDLKSGLVSMANFYKAIQQVGPAKVMIDLPLFASPDSSTRLPGPDTLVLPAAVASAPGHAS